MSDAGIVGNEKRLRGLVPPFWGITAGIAIGFLSGLGFVSWWFGPEDYTHSMALIHEGAGAILGGLSGAIVGLVFKLKKEL